MEWLIVSMVVIAGVIYILMKKIDRVLEQHSIQPDFIQQNPSSEAYALILGDTPLADCLKTLLEKQKIDYLHIKDENKLDKSKTYNRLFAVSNDDLSNMLVCIIVDQIMDHCSMIAVCNQLQDRNLFEQNNIPYLLAPQTNAETLYKIVIPA